MRAPSDTEWLWVIITVCVIALCVEPWLRKPPSVPVHKAREMRAEAAHLRTIAQELDAAAIELESEHQ